MKNRILLTAALLFTLLSLSYSQGSTYTGTYSNSSPIIWNGISNQTIEQKAITNSSGHCISLSNCSNITIRNCKLGPSKNQGVYLYKCSNITVINCSFDTNETGLYANQSSGIKFNYNDVKNVQGPYPKGQMVQFDVVSGGGNSISYNVVENILGQSTAEDAISLYKTNGIATDRIQVVGNWIRGGGPSDSGGGIMTGDAGGSYVNVADNILVNPGQYGIAIASGHHITIKNNKVYGKRQSFTNVGIYVFKQYPTECNTDSVFGNKVNFIHNTGSLNNYYNDNSCGNVTGWNTNTYDASLNENILPVKILARAKAITTDIPQTPSSEIDEKLKIFPNPATDRINIVTNSPQNKGTIDIFNLKGQKLIGLSLNSSNTEVDTTSLIKGIYIVKVTNNNEQPIIKKITINKN